MNCGSPLSVYFRQLDDFFTISGIKTDEDKLAVFRMGLQAPEYQRFVMDITLPPNYADATAKLLSIYEPPRPQQAACEEFANCYQRTAESVTLYRERLGVLLKEAYPTLGTGASAGTLLLAQLKRGLHDRRLREVARLSTLTDVDALTEELRRHELAFEETVQVNAVSPDVSSQVEALTKKVDQLTALVERNARKGFSGPCFNCGEKGHPARRCFKESAVCERCGRRHLTQYCNIDNGTRRPERQVSHSCVAGCDVTARSPPYGTHTGIFVTLSGTLKYAMVDTGAVVSVISRAFWRELGEPTPMPSSLGLVTAGKTPLVQEGRVTLPLKVSSSKFVHTFHIVPELTVDILLGSDFLNTNGCVIDFQQGQLRLKDDASKLYLQAPGTLAPVTISESTNVPGMSEALITVTVNGSLKPSEDLLITAEPVFDYFLGRKLLVGSCIVTTNSVNKVVRVLNASPDDLHLEKGQVIGKAETVRQSGGMLGSIGEMAATEDDDALRRLSWSPDLSDCENRRVLALLRRYKTLFAFRKDQIGETSMAAHVIDTKDHPPIRVTPRRLPLCHRATVQDQLEWMLEKRIIRPSSSPWSAPIVLVRKKNGESRMCIDFRDLNAITVKDRFPLPRIDDTLDDLAGAKIFSTLDLASGYYQVPVTEEDRQKTAFSTHKGLYEFCKMPFGLCNAPATFQRLMTTVLNGSVGTRCLIYLDDIICYSRDFDEHLQNLESIFMKLQEAGLTLNPHKCRLFQRQVLFLGHVVSSDGVHVDPKKIDHIQNWPTPQTKSEVKSFMGLASYYRRFVKCFSDIATPLFALSGKERFEWTPECSTAFQLLKDRLASAPVLAYPLAENSAANFVLDTDASSTAIGAILSQVVDGKERVVAFSSKALSKAQRNYCTTRRELLAVVHFCHEFRPYLLGRHFRLRTDHSSLQWLRGLKEPDGQVARWLLALQEFDFAIEHRPGKQHTNADAMSRHPRHQGWESCPACKDSQATSDVEDFSEPAPLHFISRDTVYEKQLEDHDIQIVRVAVQNDRTLDDDERKDLSEWGLRLDNQLRNLIVHNQQLKIHHQGRTKLVVPPSLSEAILQDLHSGPGGGHYGSSKLKDKVESRFWWPGYAQDVKNMTEKCRICAQHKDPPRKARAPLVPIRVHGPNEMLGMDMVGPLSTTPRGNRYLLVMIDFFTRWTEVVPVKDQRAATITPEIFNHWISRHGVPRRIHTDQGSNFESETFLSFCRQLNIQHSHSSALHPEGNGMTERFNRTLKMLLKTHNTTDTDWDLTVPSCLMAYRATQQASTKHSPYQLLYGREMPLPCDLGETPEDRSWAPGAFYNDLKAHLRKLRNLARSNNNTAKEAQKKQFDKRVKERGYEVGDPVWLYYPDPLAARKFRRHWRGPYKILEKLPPSNYRLRFWGRESGDTQVVHHNRLKPCHDVQPVSQPTNPLDSSSDSEYETSVENPGDLRFSQDSSSDDDFFWPVGGTPVSASSSSSDSTLPMTCDDSPFFVPSDRRSRIPVPSHRYSLRQRPRMATSSREDDRRA